MLVTASYLNYAYRHNPIIQARKMANPEHLTLLKRGVEAWKVSGSGIDLDVSSSYLGLKEVVERMMMLAKG